MAEFLPQQAAFRSDCPDRQQANFSQNLHLTSPAMKLRALSLQTVLCAALTASPLAMAQVVDVKGEAEVSLKANGGDLATARRIVREAAERDAIASVLKLRMSVNPDDPKMVSAANDIRKQLSDSLRTTFRTEGDIIAAKTTLNVDSQKVFALARQAGVANTSVMAAAKVLFIIDEYFGVGTKLDPSKPLTTEIAYSHDKSSNYDRSLKAGASQSASAQSASASKESVAAASSSKSSLAASSDTRVAASDQQAYAARDQQAYAARDSRAVAAKDGMGGSLAAGRDTQVAGTRDTQVAAARDTRYAASDKQAIAASSSNNAAYARNSESASASKSQSASASYIDQTDKGEKKDIVNFSMKQTFPDVGNAKPEESSMIVAQLEQTIKPYGLALVSERDFRIEGGRRMLISDIEKFQKFDAYMQKASKGNFSAKYLVYGTAKTHIEGKSPTGGTLCSGSLILQSTNVETGDSLASGTITKRAEGSIDQNCRDNLAQAMATELAKIIGEETTQDLQRVTRQGQAYSVTLYSRLDIPARLKRDFKRAMEKLATSPDEIQEGSSGDGAQQWTVMAQGQFKSKLEEAALDISDKYDEARKLSFESQGSKIYVCIEGKCPSFKDR